MKYCDANSRSRIYGELAASCIYTNELQGYQCYHFALKHTEVDQFLLIPMILGEGCKAPRVKKNNNSKFMKELTCKCMRKFTFYTNLQTTLVTILPSMLPQPSVTVYTLYTSVRLGQRRGLRCRFEMV